MSDTCIACILYILIRVVYPCVLKDMWSVNKFCSVVFDQTALTYCILSVVSSTNDLLWSVNVLMVGKHILDLNV